VVVVDKETVQGQQEQVVSIQILGFNLTAKHKDKDLLGSLTVEFFIPHAYFERIFNEIENIFKSGVSLAVATNVEAATPAVTKKGRWGADEKEFLRQYYPKFGPKVCARILGRSVASVQRRASMLGLRITEEEPQQPPPTVSSSTAPTQPISLEPKQAQLPPEDQKLSPTAQKLLERLYSIASPGEEITLYAPKLLEGENIGVQAFLKAREELVKAGFLTPLPRKKRYLPQKYRLITLDK
jgi:hypothetical protein